MNKEANLIIHYLRLMLQLKNWQAKKTKSLSKYLFTGSFLKPMWLIFLWCWYTIDTVWNHFWHVSQFNSQRVNNAHQVDCISFVKHFSFFFSLLSVNTKFIHFSFKFSFWYCDFYFPFFCAFNYLIQKTCRTYIKNF